MERSAANSDKGSKADSSKESASRIKSVGENSERELDPLQGLVQGAECRGCGPSLESVAQRMVSMPAAQRWEAAMSLQRARGNRFVQGMAVQAKMMIGHPNDKFEREADRLASNVVEQINTLASAKPIQKQLLQNNAGTNKEFQLRGDTLDRQRSRLSTDQKQEAMIKESLQTELIFQHRKSIADGDLSTDLESAISSARGGGQPLDARLQQSMEQMMGADFDGVKVHKDILSEQLNISIKSRAFTIGKDVFFRQGMYDPGSRAGKTLIAHELTHVMQQNKRSVQQKNRQTDKSASREAYSQREKLINKITPIENQGTLVLQRDFNGDLVTITNLRDNLRLINPNTSLELILSEAIDSALKVDPLSVEYIRTSGSATPIYAPGGLYRTID